MQLFVEKGPKAFFDSLKARPERNSGRALLCLCGIVLERAAYGADTPSSMGTT